MKSSTTKILLHPIGSRGDIQPLVALGQHLQKSGYEIRVAGSPNGRTMAEQYGLSFYPIGTDMRSLLEEARKSVSNPIRLFRYIFSIFGDLINEQFNEIEEHIQWADKVIMGGVTFAGISVCEAYNKPFHYMVYCPQVAPSATLGLPFIPYKTPKWFNRIAIWGFIKLFHFGGAKHINRQRKKLSIPPVKDISRVALPTKNLLFASDEIIAPIPADLKPAISSGFFYLPQKQPLAKDLCDFIAAGTPPIYVGFGSMTDPKPKRTTKMLLEAAKKTGVRLVINQGWAGLGKTQMPSYAYVVQSVSHHLLFPQMAGILHHGGAGTTAAASLSGSPQTIIPHLLDQYYWAQQIDKCEVGPKSCWKIRLTTKRLQRIFSQMTNPIYKQNAKKIGEHLRARNGLKEAQNALEAVWQSHDS